MKKFRRDLLAFALVISMVLGQTGISYAVEATDAEVVSVSGNEEVTSVSSNEEIVDVSANEEVENVSDNTEELVVSEEEETQEEVIEEIPQEEVQDEVSDKAPENEAEFVVDNLDEFSTLGFAEMSLSAEMVQAKKDMAQVVSALNEMKAHEDYRESEVVFFAETIEEAEAIVECYNGELLEFEYGVGVAKITTTVKNAVSYAANMEYDVPAVYPNVKYEINDGWNEDSLREVEVSEEVRKATESEETRSGIQLPGKEENLYAVEVNDTYAAKQWHLDDINVSEAWKVATGENTIVAVIDSGIDYGHPDLKNNIYAHLSTVNYVVTGYDDEGEEIRDKESNAAKAAADGYDDHGHGTHCSGIIAAEADNGIGVTGVAFDSKICSIKALSNVGSGDTANIVQAVYKAIEVEADVISMSLGGVCYDKAFQTAINKAVGKGIVVVAASGNEGVSQKSYPAAYNNVIAVAATEGQGYVTSFSNWGDWVDIAAPGWEILSTVPTDFEIDVTYEAAGYGYMTGTSMACPVVAGVVALMLDSNPSLKGNSKANVTKLTKALLASGDTCDEYGDWWYEYPMVNARTSVCSVDDRDVAMPEIEFSQKLGEDKKTVTAGENEWFKLTTATEGAKIYYTINGKKPTANNAYLYTGERYMPLSGKVTIQAVAMVGNKASKVFKKQYNFNVKADYLDPATDGTYTVVKGKSVQLGTILYPAYVSNKKLAWTSQDVTGMVKVDKNGKVTCNKNAQVGSEVKIIAATQDGSNLTYEFTVKVVASGVESITLNAEEVELSYWADYFRMFNKEKNEYYKSYFDLKVVGLGATDDTEYTFKSSNKKVAKVSPDGQIIPLAKGTAKITVTANDGSKKKAVCKVKVVNPVVDLYAYSSTGFYSDLDQYIPIGTGCSITMKTVINPEYLLYEIDNWYDSYGDSDYKNYSQWYAAQKTALVPNNKKILWQSDNAFVSVDKNGKVKCAPNAKVGEVVTITATADDGFGATETMKFVVTDKITKMTYLELYQNNFTGELYTVDTGASKVTMKAKVGEGYLDPLTFGLLGIKTASGENEEGYYYNGFKVTVSNRDVSYRTWVDYDYMGIIGTKPGSSKIVYEALDGSKTKFTINFKVTQ